MDILSTSTVNQNEVLTEADKVDAINILIVETIYRRIE